MFGSLPQHNNGVGMFKWAVMLTVFLAFCSSQKTAKAPYSSDSRAIDTQKPAAYEEYRESFGSPAKESDFCDGKSNQMIWKFKGDSAEVYLFGSIHFGIADFYPFSEKIEYAFEKSDFLVVEINTSSESIENDLASLMSKGLYPDGGTIKKELSPQIYEQLVNVLTQMGLPFDNFQNFKPWLMALTLSAMRLSSLGYTPEMGVESYFLSKAHDKSILELESAESQIKLLSELDGEDFLRYTIFWDSLTSVMLEELTSAWICGDSVAMDDIVLKKYTDQMESYEEFYQVMFADRNRQMADIISGFLNTRGTYFVVVGAGHYLGPHSIIEMLIELGHSVKRI